MESPPEENDLQYDPRLIEIIRALYRRRIAYSHAKVSHDVPEEHRKLSLPYPIDDYPTAGQQVTWQFREALRKLAASVE